MPEPRNREERRHPERGERVRLDQLIKLRPFLTERWVRRLVYERRIPFYKAGDGAKARLVFDLDEIDRWLEAGRVEATG